MIKSNATFNFVNSKINIRAELDNINNQTYEAIQNLPQRHELESIIKDMDDLKLNVNQNTKDLTTLKNIGWFVTATQEISATRDVLINPSCQITWDTNPTKPNDLVNKNYVDNSIKNELDVDDHVCMHSTDGLFFILKSYSRPFLYKIITYKNDPYYNQVSIMRYDYSESATIPDYVKWFDYVYKVTNLVGASIDLSFLSANIPTRYVSFPKFSKILEISYFFQFSRNLEKISLPYGLEILSTSAFDGCSKLTDVSLPSTLKEIKNYAFRNCTSLKTIYIPASVILLDEAFSGCSFTEFWLFGSKPIEYRNLITGVTITTVYCRDSDAATLYKNMFLSNQSIKLFDGTTFQ
jgi:hypothetical protein